jgi:predicted DNA-binding protein
MIVDLDIPKRIFNAPEGYKRLTINLPVELHTKLKIVAATKEKTSTEIIESLLEEHLK